MDLLVKAHNKYLSLESKHPKDNSDWINSSYVLQDILTRRARRRVYPDVFVTIKARIPKTTPEQRSNI